MSKKLLIIKTGMTIPPLLEQGEDFEKWFSSGCEVAADQFLVTSIYLDEPLPTLSRVSGIIITGSAAYVTDLAAWNYVAADYLRSAHEKGVPLLGVCYGHQLLAWAFGGSVEFHKQGREIGTVDILSSEAAREDAMFASLPPRFKAQVSHLQTVTALPPGAVLLASNSFDENHAFRLGERTWSVQFHPEFSATAVSAYIRFRADAIAAEGMVIAELLEAVTDTPDALSILPRFARLCAELESSISS